MEKLSVTKYLRLLCRISSTSTFAWQGENGPPLVCSAQAMALQFLRCVLHQLAPNGIFVQILQTEVVSKCTLWTGKSKNEDIYNISSL